MRLSKRGRKKGVGWMTAAAEMSAERMADLERRVLALEERTRISLWSDGQGHLNKADELVLRHGEYVDKTDAARILGVTRATVYAMLADGSGYFVELDGQLVGICKGIGNRVEAIASVLPGKGKDILLALCKQLGGNRFCLQVADTNTRAVSLYERLGFVKTKEISCWYKIL